MKSGAKLSKVVNMTKYSFKIDFGVDETDNNMYVEFILQKPDGTVTTFGKAKTIEQLGFFTEAVKVFMDALNDNSD